MTEYLDPDDVEQFIASTGFHLRDRNLLRSALAAPQPVLGHDPHPDLYDKAAALLIAINRNHPLLDGNKRLSWILTKAFLALNGHHLTADSIPEADKFIRNVAAHQLQRTEITTWIQHHTRTS